MSVYELVNAVTTMPHRCEFCTSNQAPFINTKTPRPTGGTFHVCSTCWRQFLIVLEAVAKLDHDVIVERLKDANEQIETLRAERVDVDVVTAELTNANAELELLRAERHTMIARIAELERDN